MFRLFDTFFDWLTKGYTALVSLLIRLKWLVVLGFIGLLVATWWAFKITPTGFVPEEDKGAFMVMFNLKPGTALSKTSEVRTEIEEILTAIEGVKDVIIIDGYNLLSSTLDSSAGAGFVSLNHGMSGIRRNLPSDRLSSRST